MATSKPRDGALFFSPATSTTCSWHFKNAALHVLFEQGPLAIPLGTARAGAGAALGGPWARPPLALALLQPLIGFAVAGAFGTA